MPLIVKIGGSFAGSAALHPWLAAIAGSRGQVVVVPGGGPFADTVRAQQGRLGYDDRAAHDMALMAMGQFGTALAGASPRLRPADSAAEIRQALAAGAVPVWRPWPMLREAPDVEAGWHVTSDSLALVLAARLGAAGVLLVKQVTAADDLVDAAFPAYRARFAGPVRVTGPDEAPSALDAENPPGRRLA